MAHNISDRLLTIVNLLPLQEGLRILEIGCGMGVAAREIVNRFENIYVLGIDRSEKAIAQAIKNSEIEIATGKLEFRKVAIEDFELNSTEGLFDIAFAVRVGALDGRHPEVESRAREQIRKLLTPGGKLYIDYGPGIKELTI